MSISPPASSSKVKKKGKLTIQCDEMGSFVGNKGNKQWKELVIDALTKEILGVYIGSRAETGSRGLWDSLPAVYRQCTVYYTDFWVCSQKKILPQRHKSLGKDTDKTSDIERFNNTLRPRRSRYCKK